MNVDRRASLTLVANFVNFYYIIIFIIYIYIYIYIKERNLKTKQNFQKNQWVAFHSALISSHKLDFQIELLGDWGVQS